MNASSTSGPLNLIGGYGPRERQGERERESERDIPPIKFYLTAVEVNLKSDLIYIYIYIYISLSRLRGFLGSYVTKSGFLPHRKKEKKSCHTSVGRVPLQFTGRFVINASCHVEE